MWNLRQNLESSGHQEKYKSHTALRNRCCIDTKRCSGGYTQPVQVNILSHRCCVCVDTKRDHGGQENNSRLCGIWGKIWSSGHQEKYKSHTSIGRKFAPVEGLSHDLVCTGSIYHVHFAWQVWHGQLSPRFKFNKITKKLFRGGNWPESCWQKDSRGKGFCSRTTQEA